MGLVLLVKMRTGADGGGGVHAGSSSRWVAKSRLSIEGVSLNNRSWPAGVGLLRVAASSNMALNPAPFSRWTLRDKAAQRRLAPR